MAFRRGSDCLSRRGPRRSKGEEYSVAFQLGTDVGLIHERNVQLLPVDLPTEAVFFGLCETRGVLENCFLLGTIMANSQGFERCVLL